MEQRVPASSRDCIIMFGHQKAVQWTRLYKDQCNNNLLSTSIFLHTYLQAQAYFRALPASKSPVRGTPGEKYHQKQLIRQLPAHDVDMMYCNELTEEEVKQMGLFVKMRKEKCVGRGEVKTKTDGVTWVRSD